MKKIIIPVGILFATGSLYGQTNTENYLQTKTYLEPVTATSSTAKQIQTVEYYDGLGRVKQSVNVKASPLGNDIVNHTVFDDFGRQTINYLPIPHNTTQNGEFFTDPLMNGANPNIYGSEKFYSEKILENSPLDRIKEKINVGNDWTAKPIKYEYGTNINGEVKRYTATFNYSTFQSDITLTGTYAENLLHKNTITDEDGNKIIEFTNSQGKTLLVRKMLSDSAYADTYYVYNNYDQLAFIIPPLAENSVLNEQTVNDLCYQYKFDERSRLVEKKLPGKGWEQMVYNKSGKIVLYRDANLKSGIPGFIENEAWVFTKYDKYGRIAYTGISRDGTSRKDIQNYVDGQAIDFESRGGSLSLSGMVLEYGNNVYPTSLSKILSVNYYDTYPQLKPDPVSSIMGQNVLSDLNTAQFKTKNLLTASFTKNIEDDNWTRTYTYYDLKGKVIASHSINFLGGFTRVESELDFSGIVKNKITKHKRLTTDLETVITENFTYDFQNRLLKHTHQINGNPVETLAQNTYNELSQLSNKKVGSGTSVNGGGFLQSIDYQYNIRGWMTKINDPVNLNGKLFGYELRYNNPISSNIASGRFNGNVAEIDWNNGSENLLKRYNYEYDRLNRLKNGFYSEPNVTNPANGNFDEYLTYYLNGNINTLQRKAPPVSGQTSALVDNLEYKYTGNRLNQVIESAMNDTGYEGGNNMIDYDANGNMINMLDKGINPIAYNYLNLPNSYSIENKSFGLTMYIGLNYLYRADGTKLRKVYSSRPVRGLTSYTTTDYLDGFQYSHREGGGICITCRTESAFEEQAYGKLGKIFPDLGEKPTWKLEFVPTSEGFYSFTENRYIYQYKDHLGNARVSFAKNSAGVLEVTDTNNYYPFGLNHISGMFGLSNFGALYSYKYNGKELQESGMYDYGARFYMPDLAKWGSIDPQAEKMTSNSPYNYAFNNPMRFIDPDGRSPYDWVEVNGKVFWDSRATDPFKTSILYGNNAIYHAPNSFGYPTAEGYVLLSSDRTWIRNGEEFTAPEHGPTGVDYNHARAIEEQAKSFNDYSSAVEDSYQNTWGDRSNITTSGILMPRDGDLRWGAFELSFSFEQNLYLPKTYGAISGSLVMTDSGEGGGFLSAGPGLGTDSDGRSTSINFNIYQNTNPFDNYMRFSDFAGWQKNNSISIPVPQLRSNINANWGSGATYNYFGIGRGKLGIPSAAHSASYTDKSLMWRMR
ncbi:DUF6443 domain-containing protein [Chryseobacterium joostei]|uniref:DUF6443 domain-containing protein n=1 Tax=Chryseobacterium joostei TaxID=112234 RepID=UPI003D146DE7